MARQQSFGFIQKAEKEFGGSLLDGKRKTARPLSLKTPLHLIMRAEQARGKTSLFWGKKKIEKILRSKGKNFGVLVYDICVHSNHIHLVIKTASRKSYAQWIRAVSSEIVGVIRKATGLELANFFDHRPYSRIISWGRDFKNALSYLKMNISQVESLYPKDIFPEIYGSS